MAMTSSILSLWSRAILISVKAVTLLLCLSPTLGAVCCTHRSKVAYYYSDEAIKVGACGFKAAAGMLQRGNVAAVSPSLFNNGRGCSACYKIKCLNTTLCRTSGTTVVTTDMTSNPQTEFVIPQSTFGSLALPGKGVELIKHGIVDIKYKRIFCEYKGHNLTVKVDETSQYPYYLAVEFLYQGGQTEIVSAEIATVHRNNWQPLSRNYGAVWQINNPPESDLQFRITVTSGYDGYTLWAKGVVLPTVWRRGGLYDCGLQINQIDNEGNGCYECSASARVA